MRAFIGTYTKQEGHVDGKADGIYSCRFDPETGALEVLCDPAPTVNPSYLCVHPDGRHLYAANEMFEDLCDPHATLSAFEIRHDGSLEEINTISSEGVAPCYVTTDPEGRNLYGVNYQTGRVFVAKVRDDGGLDEVFQTIQHEGTGPHPGQDGPHAHSIYLDPETRRAVVPDKGADRVFVYGLRGNGELKHGTALRLPEGAGPRHFAFHPGGKWGYVLNELNSTITSCFWQDGRLTPFETVRTIPDDFDGRNSTADIHVTQDGRYLYASNRGHDSIAAFHVDATTGALVPIKRFPSGGQVPRGFGIDPTGQWLVCANQNSDNIVTFRIHPVTGYLEAASEVEVPTPVCVKFLEN